MTEAKREQEMNKIEQKDDKKKPELQMKYTNIVQNYKKEY